MAERPRVVIIGSGFGGLAAAKALRHAAVDVTVLDRTNHYLFQPLLYQVATGVLSPADIAVPARLLLRRQRNATVLLAEVESVDVDRQVVHAEGGQLRIAFDYLIVAPGARHAYFGHPEWESLAPGLKTLEDAREIRTRFLLAFERAEKEPRPAEQANLLTFVVVGGGPTGVELAGILPTIARRGFKGDFRRINPAQIRVVLVEAGPRLLPTFPERLSRRALRDLETLGVQCRTGTMVTRITGDSVYLGEERIPTRTVFWAAGNAASPLIRRMKLPVDRAGRAQVLADLSVPGHPHVFVIGDAAAAEMTPDIPRGRERSSGAPSYVPGLATAAQQMGAHAAEGILRTLADKERVPFRYRDRGSMAVIGRNRAVAVIAGLQLAGHVAFWLWLLVHIMYLAGFRNRLSVLVEWGYAFFTFRPGARLLTDLTPPPPPVDTQQPPQT